MQALVGDGRGVCVGVMQRNDTACTCMYAHGWTSKYRYTWTRPGVPNRYHGAGAGTRPGLQGWSHWQSRERMAASTFATPHHHHRPHHAHQLLLVHLQVALDSTSLISFSLGRCDGSFHATSCIKACSSKSLAILHKSWWVRQLSCNRLSPRHFTQHDNIKTGSIKATAHAAAELCLWKHCRTVPRQSNTFPI